MPLMLGAAQSEASLQEETDSEAHSVMWMATKSIRNYKGIVHYWIESRMGPELRMAICGKPTRTIDKLEEPTPAMKRCEHCLAKLSMYQMSTTKKNPSEAENALMGLLEVCKLQLEDFFVRVRAELPAADARRVAREAREDIKDLLDARRTHRKTPPKAE